MELIERYLQAVKFWLPKKQQDDIIAELSEDLHAQLEEREAELARHLTEPEIEDLLRRRGSPARVALGYLPQRSLIGPALFPIYIFVLKIVTVASVALTAAGCIAEIAGHTMRHATAAGWIHFIIGTARPLAAGWLFAAAIVTLLFAVFERTPVKSRLLDTWNPRQLPPLQPMNSIARFNSICGISGLACLLLFWVLEMAPPLTIRLGNLQIETTPQWSFVFWAVLTLTVGAWMLEITNLLRPWWTSRRAAIRLVLDVGGFSVFCWSVQAHFVANVSWPGGAPEETAFTTALLNRWLAHVFPWAAAVKLVVVAFDVWRLARLHSRKVREGLDPVRNPL